MIPHIMAWAAHNEAGIMGEEEAPLRSLHFLELMTSLRATGTVPLTPSGSSRAHHRPAGTQRGGAGRRVGLEGGQGRAVRGPGGRNKGRSPNVCKHPTVALSPSLSPSFLSL